jgi:outer membrane protein assembly factor BamA
LLACALVFAFGFGPAGENLALAQAPSQAQPAVAGPIQQWNGLPVRHISFEGVTAERLDPLPGHLAQSEGKPLNPDSLRQSLRELYGTGLYESVLVEGSRGPDGVDLVFRGTPRIFIGTVGVYGAKGPTLNAQLQRASQLVPGTRFTQANLSTALKQMRQTLAENGFYEPTITPTQTPHPDEQLVDLTFQAISGQQARVGRADVTGDPGISVLEFRRYAHLKAGANVDHDTGNRALSGVLKHYQGERRMEAEIKIVSEKYDSARARASVRTASSTSFPSLRRAVLTRTC